MFLPTWWLHVLQYASRVANSGQALVRKIHWDPSIDGEPRPDWRRTLVAARDDPKRRQRYALHEAFPPGAEICVRAVLPSGLSLAEFAELLRIAGAYQGLSPYQIEGDCLGTFEVLEAVPAAQAGRPAPQTPDGEPHVLSLRADPPPRHAD